MRDNLCYTHGRTSATTNGYTFLSTGYTSATVYGCYLCYQEGFPLLRKTLPLENPCPYPVVRLEVVPLRIFDWYR